MMLRIVRRAFLFLLLCLCCALFMFWFEVHEEKESVSYEWARERTARFWAKWTLWLLDLKLVGESAERLNDLRRKLQNKACLVVSNHRSSLDVLVLLYIYGGHMLSRHDLEYTPLLGPLAKMVGTLFVDREDKKERLFAIRNMTNILKKNKVMMLFPEGTTYSGDDVRAFQEGSFLSAIQAKAPILPIGLAYEEEILCFTQKELSEHLSVIAEHKSSRIAFCIGDDVSCAGKNRSELSNLLQKKTQALVNTARASLTG